MSHYFICGRIVSLFLSTVFFDVSVDPQTLQVGPDKPFQRIEEAVQAATEGDEIVVHPNRDGSPYRQPVLMIRKAKLKIRSADPEKPVMLDGAGYEYSGHGSIPRAIVQFDPGADGCVLDGFVLTNARNGSHNGAGVRINAANNVTVRNCVIHANDMGIMSGGEVSRRTGAGQRIEKCKIFENGTDKDPGYNHNLYVGGTDVTVVECDISRSTTGHNLKSRAHRLFVINCVIHDSCNRELDLVDGVGNTDVPESDSFLVGNTIVKDSKCSGNKTVIHFGRDGAAHHTGTLWLIDNTIRTPFVSPIAHLSDGNGIVLIGNRINEKDPERKTELVRRKDSGMIVAGEKNVLPPDSTIHTVESGETTSVKLEKSTGLPEALMLILKQK